LSTDKPPDALVAAVGAEIGFINPADWWYGKSLPATSHTILGFS